MNSEDEFDNISPWWISNLSCNIEEKTAQPEDVELLMRYYCHLYESPDDFNPKVLREVLRLINQVFAEYLNRKYIKKQESGALDAAFGLTGIQGKQPKLQERDEILQLISRDTV